MAVATSEASARVGTGALTIDSSICVATITGLPSLRHSRTMRFWIAGTCSAGISTPRGNPVVCNDVTDVDDMTARAIATAKDLQFAERGQTIVIAAGMPFGTPGS